MVPALLDSGATVSAIPEEVLCGVLSYFQSRIGSGEDDDDDRWPVRKIERYTSPTSVSGLGQGSATQTRYAAVLRVSFVSIGEPWDKASYQDIYVKVLPKGTAQVPGVLLGYPVLDPRPPGGPATGLGHV
eukprot:5427395-Alexandrium_andersonii.AAC.1